jgi:hypothetical protein
MRQNILVLALVLLVSVFSVSSAVSFAQPLRSIGIPINSVRATNIPIPSVPGNLPMPPVSHTSGKPPFLYPNISYVGIKVLHQNRTFLDGFIGVYNGVVYIEFFVPLHELTLGNTTFVAEPPIEAFNGTPPIQPMKYVQMPMQSSAPSFIAIPAPPHKQPAPPQAMFFGTLGVINSAYAVSYVKAHKGQAIIVLWRGLVPVTLKDVGTYNAMPRGHVLIYYELVTYSYKPIPMGAPFEGSAFKEIALP